VGDDVKRERARELALHIMTDKNIAEQIASIILAACAEQRETRRYVRASKMSLTATAILTPQPYARRKNDELAALREKCDTLLADNYSLRAELEKRK
jgi:hypothetical protein